MKLSPIQIEQLVSSTSPAESFVERRPDNDLTTPLGRLRFIRDAAERAPNRHFDMRKYWSEAKCGCALFHACKAGLEIDTITGPDMLGLSRDAFCSLFRTTSETLPKYLVPNGAEGKAEFLRRIDEAISLAGEIQK